MSTGKETLARFRPALPGERVRTVWKSEHDCWVCYHEDATGILWSEMLPVSDPDDTIGAIIAEIRSCNICSPLLASCIEECNGQPRVFPDRKSGYWTAWLPCQHCGGFPIRLHMKIGSVDHPELEGETARLLAHRILFFHGRDRDPEFCAGCRSKEIQSGKRTHGLWLSMEEQAWYYRIEEGPLVLDVPLELPSWTKPADLRDKMKRVRGQAPYDWEKDGE